MDARGARMLVVGLDGATFDVLGPLMAEGRCPVLRRLAEEGARSHLRSTTPPMTLPSWSSFLTGCGPGTHGIFDFTRRVPGTYRLEFTNATHRRVPTVHRVLSERGKRTASIAMPTTYPPDPIDGVVISGFDSPVATTIDGRFCHPPSLYPELMKRFGGMAFADFQEIDIDEDWHAQALDSMLSEIVRKEEISRYLLRQERWELFTVLFGESDTASHHFWMFHDPESPRYREHPRFSEAIRQVYERLDEALGRLIEEAQPEIVCIASDHGFGGAGDRILYLNRFLEEHGWLQYKGRSQPVGGGVRSGSGWLDAAKAKALAVLPAKAQQALVRALPGSVLGAVETASRYGDIDFAGSRAFSDEMNYAACIHLNVVGRDPQGCVEDREAAIEALTTLLLSWRVEGEPVVQKVHRREDIYQGDAVDSSPDLVLDLALPGGYSYTLLPSARAKPGETWRRLERSEHVGGKGLGMNGSHRQHGVLLLWGEGVAKGVEVSAGMADCVPTLMTLLGEPIPDWCDGVVLRRALDGVRPIWEEQDRSAGPVAPLGEGDSQALARRLERLGYL